MTRLFDRLRAEGITPTPGAAPPIGGGRTRPGSDFLARGQCGRGHPIATVYDLQIRHDRIRCLRCVDDAELERARVVVARPREAR